MAWVSCRLDNVIRGLPAGLISVAVVAAMTDKSQTIVPSHDCVTFAPHAITDILTTSATQYLFAAYHSGYEALILAGDNIALKHSPPLNLAPLVADYVIKP